MAAEFHGLDNAWDRLELERDLANTRYYRLAAIVSQIAAEAIYTSGKRLLISAASLERAKALCPPAAPEMPVRGKP
jgi:hypothetical protein